MSESHPDPELPQDFFNRPLAEVDPEVAEVLRGELHRQQGTLEMIASENFVPLSVLECQGSVLTNKYAEGYPGRRYYGGCEWVDVSEQLAIDRAWEPECGWTFAWTASGFPGEKRAFARAIASDSASSTWTQPP